jgi:hypothetical protein
MRKIRDLTGQKFGRLTVVKDSGKRIDHGVVWECDCDCGKKAFVISRNLTNKLSKSCGCLRKEKTSITGKMISKKNIKKNIIEGTNIGLIKNNKLNKNNTTGFKGVTYFKGYYQSKIQFKKVRYYLGYYETAEEASDAYQIAKSKMHGEFLKWYEKEYKNNKNVV